MDTIRTSNFYSQCALCFKHCALRVLLCIVGTWSAAHGYAIDWPAMAVPVINYSPETNWLFGAAAQGYFQIPEQQRTSIVQIDGAYSLQHQWYINAQGTLYFAGKKPFRLLFRGGYRDYPDIYYPLGNGGKQKPVRKTGQVYTSQRGYFHIEPTWQPVGNFGIGIVDDFITEHTTQLAVPHPDMLMWGLGLVLQYDSRDNTFYPHKGLFFKAMVTYYDKNVGSTECLTHIDFNLRQYIPLYKELIFAWQFRTTWAATKKDALLPFQMLPTIGGQDLLRGVPRNMYRDDLMFALQGELRIPIWKYLKGCIFGGFGDVYHITSHSNPTTPNQDYPSDNPDTSIPYPNSPVSYRNSPSDKQKGGYIKVGYGAGLRLTINRAKVNIRFDVARNNIDRAWNTLQSYSLYLTATEAF